MGTTDNNSNGPGRYASVLYAFGLGMMLGAGVSMSRSSPWYGLVVIFCGILIIALGYALTMQSSKKKDSGPTE